MCMFMLTGIVGSPDFWLWSLVACLGSYGLWRLVSSIAGSVKRWRSTIASVTKSPEEADELMAQILPWKSAETKKATRNASKWVGVLALILGAYLFGHYRGYALGSLTEKQAILAVVHDVTTRVTYTDVDIKKQLEANTFLVQPARMASLKVTICPSSTVDWKPGERLTDWTFEQLPGCKHVVSYHKES